MKTMALAVKWLNVKKKIINEEISEWKVSTHFNSYGTRSVKTMKEMIKCMPSTGILEFL